MVKRRLTGYGQERGSIGIEFINLLNEPIKVLWMEEWPWWLKIYVHTLQGHVDGKPVILGKVAFLITILTLLTCTMARQLNSVPTL